MKSFGRISKSICCVLLIAGLIIGGGCFGDVGFLGLQNYQRDLLVGGLAAAALLSSDGDTGGEPEPGAPGARGADGEDGAAGAAGVDGVDGVDGADGEPGAQGELGPAGPQGPAGQQGPAGPAGAAGSSGSDGAAGADGVAFFDIFIDDFFTISGNPDGQLPVGLVKITEPALGVPAIDVETGEEVPAAIAYRVAMPETYNSGNDVTMRLFFYRPGADVEGCLVMTLDALRLRDGEDVADYGERIWIQLEGSAKDAARASSIVALLGEEDPSGVGFVIDVPINSASGLINDPNDLEVGDLLAFELATGQADDETICHDGGRYQILGVEFFEGAPGSATPAGGKILGTAPETCCELGE